MFIVWWVGGTAGTYCLQSQLPLAVEHKNLLEGANTNIFVFLEYKISQLQIMSILWDHSTLQKGKLIHIYNKNCFSVCQRQMDTIKST